MSWVSVALAGANLVGGLIGSNAASSAGGTQAAAANAATAAQQQYFQQVNANNQPYLQSGINSLGLLNVGLGSAGIYTGQDASTIQNEIASLQQQQAANGGNNANPVFAKEITNAEGALNAAQAGITPGQFTHQFDAADLQTNLAPNYQFMLQQGLGALGNLNNAAGGGFSNDGQATGNMSQGAIAYAENYASNAYQNAFNNYNTNQTNIYNRLSGVAGMGQQANQTIAGAANTASQGTAATIQGAGAAQAAGQVGSANALSQGISNAAGIYTLNNLLSPATGGGGTVNAGTLAGFLQNG